MQIACYSLSPTDSEAPTEIIK